MPWWPLWMHWVLVYVVDCLSSCWQSLVQNFLLKVLLFSGRSSVLRLWCRLTWSETRESDRLSWQSTTVGDLARNLVMVCLLLVSKMEECLNMLSALCRVEVVVGSSVSTDRKRVPTTARLTPAII